MKTQKLHVTLIATSLLAACASQPAQPPKATSATAASSTAAAASSAPNAAAASATGAAENEDGFRKVERSGQTLYCDKGDRLGSRMARPRCLTEDQYAAWKENNKNRQDELDRVRDASAGAARAPGPGAGGR